MPNEVWPGIILSHWGRKDAEHVSNTAYGPDNYSAPHVDDWQKDDWRLIHSSPAQHPCYDPDKVRGHCGKCITHISVTAHVKLLLPYLTGPHVHGIGSWT